MRIVFITNQLRYIFSRYYHQIWMCILMQRMGRNERPYYKMWLCRIDWTHPIIQSTLLLSLGICKPVYIPLSSQRQGRKRTLSSLNKQKNPFEFFLYILHRKSSKPFYSAENVYLFSSIASFSSSENILLIEVPPLKV